jgi:uncharacterized small protein (DUF1192 family)
MITAVRRTRPTGHMADPEYVAVLSLKSLATRSQCLAAEIATVDAALQKITSVFLCK